MHLENLIFFKKVKHTDIIAKIQVCFRFTKVKSIDGQWTWERVVESAATSAANIHHHYHYTTMCDFHNFGLIFMGQYTVCLKG